MKHTVILPILFSATLFAGCTTVGNYMGNDTVSLNKEAAMAYQQKKKEHQIDTTPRPLNESIRSTIKCYLGRIELIIQG